MRRPVGILFLVLGGCNSVQPPTVMLESARTAHDADASLITFTLHAENPNRDPLPLEEVRYEVWVDGAPVFSGTRLALATLPSFGTRRVTIPAAVPKVVPAGARFRIAAEVVYRPPSHWRQTLHEAGFSYPAASLDAEGELQAP